MASSRSALDRKVHRRGAELTDSAVMHPVGSVHYPTEGASKEKRDREFQSYTVNLARDALQYKRLRDEQEVEGLTNKFARMSLDDNTMNLRRRIVG